MSDENDKRVRGSAIPRMLEPVGSDALLMRTEADMKGLLVSLHVWDTGTGAWVKMVQPTIEAGDLYVAVDGVESLLGDIDEHVLNVRRACREKFWRDERIEYSGGKLIYLGRNETMNEATSATTWFIRKYTYDGDDVVRIQAQVTSWDNRASGWS